jgi:uncharacterized repeat protein (TIGR03803 family)
MARILRLCAALCLIGGTAAAQTAQVLHQFSDPPTSPQSSLVEVSPGVLIGLSQTGGGGTGTMYRRNADGTVTLLHSFNDDGGSGEFGGVLPGQSLLLHDGYIYFTRDGGPTGRGLIYKMEVATSALTVLHAFGSTEGSEPRGGLSLGSDGLLYGVTLGANTGSLGTLYRIDPVSGAFTTLVTFNGANGVQPFAPPVQASNGFFYGPVSGGAGDRGSIYKFDPVSGAFTLIHAFTSANGESVPSPPFIVASDGKLYAPGGALNEGAIYRLDPTTDAVTVAVSFSNTGGRFPFARLVQGIDGQLYGTLTGGLGLLSAIYRADPATGAFGIVHEFPVNNGANTNMRSGLLRASDGLLYGVEERGGALGLGQLFSYAPATDVATTLYDFGPIVPGGAQPLGLVRASNGLSYGTTLAGGSNRAGTLFEFNAGVPSLTPLQSFTSFSVTGTLTEGPDGNLYGAISRGGFSGSFLFRHDPVSATFTGFNFFSSSNQPTRGMTRGADGLMYGAQTSTSSGASSIFRFVPGGSTISLFATLPGTFFLNPSNFAPIVASDGHFYGLSSNGGTTFGGTLYKVDRITRAVTILHSFDATTPLGARPTSDLTEGPDGRLYGATATGGAGGFGAIFRYDLASNAMTVVQPLGVGGFGREVVARFVADTHGMLYGTTSRGGAQGRGTVFRLDPATGAASIVYSLTAAEGRAPRGTMVLGDNGDLYVAAQKEGPDGGGTIFRLDLNDDTAPTVSIASPTATAYALHQAVNASFTCADAESGVASCTGTVANGAAIDTATAGAKTFTVSATNGDGDSHIEQVFYTVNKGAPTVIVTGGTFPFDGLAHPAAVAVTGGVGETLGPATVTYNGSPTPPIAVGTYTVVASFAGDDNYESGEAQTTIKIEKASTTTTLVSEPNPSSAVEVVRLTATVTTAPSVNPTGQVQFFDGATLLGSAALNASRVATITTTTLAAGAHSLTATYVGDGSFNGSTSSAVALTVTPLASSTITALFVSPAPSQVGTPANLIAIVVPLGGTGAPAGTVQFFDGSIALGSAPLTPSGGYQVATLTTSGLAAGVHALQARYAGDGTFGGSVSPLTLQTVYVTTPPAATTTTLTTTPNPSGLGQTFSITIQVRSPSGVPSGSVYLSINGTIVAALPLTPSGGVGRVIVPITGGLPRGLYVMSAIYVGTAQFAASSSQNTYQCVACSLATAIQSSAPSREDDPDVGAIVPRTAAIVAEDRVDAEAGPFEPARHLADRQGAEHQREVVLASDAVADRDVPLIEHREATGAILRDRFDERYFRAPAHASRQGPARVVL